MKEKIIKKINFFVSPQKEIKWLEDMALQGLFLKNVNLGLIYTFVQGEPKRMLYDIDRFDLPKKPTLEEIQHKELFMEMAKEMGWKEVTHDETLMYYFAKEYKEGDINELHNDEESRMYRAKKFRNYMLSQAKELLKCMMLIITLELAFILLDIEAKGFQGFGYGYIIICGWVSLFSWKIGFVYERELSMTRAEWEKSIDSNTHKTVRKLIFTIRGLNKFLTKEQENGWILKNVTATTYSFEKSTDLHQVYTLDSRWLTNKRWKEKKHFLDLKDIEDKNHDWQLQSVKDAEEKGWKFVCALENRGIIYKGDKTIVEPLNDSKYDNSFRCVSIIGIYGLVLMICVFIGFVAGFVSGMMSLDI